MGSADQAVHGAVSFRTVIAFSVLAVGVVLLGALWVSRRQALPDDDLGDVVRVGVVQGQTVGGYIASARKELASLTKASAPVAGDTWALVSLDRYVAPGSLPDLFSGAAVAEVYTRVPLSGVHTQVVRIPVYRLPADVMTGMLDASLDRDREAAEYRQLSRRTAADQVRARQAYEAAAVSAAAEAAAYRTGCSCVFAAVIRGAPTTLQGVATRPGVRVVDPAPEVLRLDRTEFRPPLPEQSGTVPPDSGPSPVVPNDVSGIATRTSAPILSSLGVPSVRSASSSGDDSRSRPAAPTSEDRPAVPSASDAKPAQDVPSRSPAAP
ncbi:hypothetical protein HH310_32165 [Actinoplanes sp. TBRC 11911]|uniref:hypothetical protein n=1 Tax=Actinoplanes sp. TBRC 11911 TaxID=2729386 RepID=UPI00145F4CC3|nr:hypothetical protein [Actinoplanes sp. TBRC 11911]NMO55824.1 hypothetical protein [Actinoplanes sp. TBRC 11911]